VKKCGQRHHVLFDRAKKDMKFASSLCKIRCSKPQWAFLEVVEGSLFYNIAYYLLVHFSSNIMSYFWSNRVL
jgi:hypothetical protein